jgi:hypothetical protein
MTNEQENIEEQNNSQDWPITSFALIGILGFMLGGCYIGNIASKQLVNSEAVSYRDEKDGIDKLRITTGNGTEILLIKPRGYTNYISVNSFKSNEINKLERKLNSEVNTK